MNIDVNKGSSPVWPAGGSEIPPPPMPVEPSGVNLTHTTPPEPSQSPKQTSWLINNAENCDKVLNKAIGEDKKNLKEKLETAKTAADLVVSEQATLTGPIQEAEGTFDPVLNVISTLEKNPILFANENEVAKKKKSLEQLEESLNEPQLSEKDREILNSRIQTLKSQISTLEDTIQTEQIDMAATAVKGTVSTAKSVTTEASQLANAASHALHIAGPSLGIAGGVIGTVACGINLKNDLKMDDLVSAKFDELVKLLNQTEPGTFLHKIIMIKLQQLEQQSQDLGFSLVKNYVGVLSSTLGVSASIGNVVAAAGVVISAKALALISGTGIGALVLGIPVLIGGTAYLVYRNKEAISHGLDTAGNVLQVEWEKSQKEKVDAKLQKMKSLEGFLSEAQDRKNKITNYYQARIEQLTQEKVKLHDQLFYVEDNEDSFFDRVSSYITKVEIEGKIKDVDKQMQDQFDQIRKFRKHEEKMIKIIEEKISSTSTKEALSSELKSRITKLESEKATLEKKGEYIAMASNLKGTSWQEIQTMEEGLKHEITQMLEQDPLALEHVKAFLTQQGFLWEIESFDENPALAILKYMTKKETA